MASLSNLGRISHQASAAVTMCREKSGPRAAATAARQFQRKVVPPLLVSLMLIGRTVGQERLAQSSAEVHVQIGSTSVHALQLPREVHIPVSLSVVSEVDVVQVRLEISFLPKLLSFLDVTRGRAARLAGAKIETASREGDNGQRVLKLDIVAPRRVPGGTVLTLNFDVSKVAQVEDAVRLSLLSYRAETSDGQPAQADGVGGIIAIDASPVPACFFYMH